jgi:hypothetical protein
LPTAGHGDVVVIACGFGALAAVVVVTDVGNGFGFAGVCVALGVMVFAAALVDVLEGGVGAIAAFGTPVGATTGVDLVFTVCAGGNFAVVVIGAGLLGLLGTGAAVGAIGVSWILPGVGAGI